MPANLDLKPVGGRRGKIEVQNPTTFGLGKSDTKNLRASFPKHPGFSGEETDATITMKFFQPPEMSNGQINDGGVYFGIVNRYYQDAPDLRTVEIGGRGLPGTPYSPNVASFTDRWNTDTVPHSPSHDPNTAQNGKSSSGGGAFMPPEAVNPKEGTEKLLGRILPRVEMR